MTTRATWKKRELGLAHDLGGERLPVSGRTKDEPDAETPMFVIQSKHKKSHPSYLWTWLSGICGVAKDRNKTGILVISKPRQDRSEALVIMRYADFLELHGVHREEEL